VERCGLAGEAAVSVSLLDERFREVLGLAPIRYLTGWRMHLARDLLHATDLSVAGVARRVGYDELPRRGTRTASPRMRRPLCRPSC
jgi:AraC-like DNA-binding protein